MTFFERINELLEQNRTLCLVTVVEPDRAGRMRRGGRAIVLPDGSVTDQGGFGDLSTELSELALHAVAARKKGLYELENGASVFVDLIADEPKLLICGAGHIAVPLASFARQVGFKVTVLDDRPEFAAPSRFPACTVIAEDFSTALQKMPVSPSTYAVVITRGHEHDTECLLELLPRRTAYVGLIGSRRRIEFVRQIIAKEGIESDRFDEVFTPIGLPVGAETPQEIALCIAAELMCVRKAGVDRARRLRAAAGGAK
jgi:xanthine dehydrogenase accessory factor